MRTEVRSKEMLVVEKVMGRTRRDCPFWLTIFVGVIVPLTVRVTPTEEELSWFEMKEGKAMLRYPDLAIGCTLRV